MGQQWRRSALRQVGSTAIELDAFRAEEGRSVLDHVIQGNCFDVHPTVESFSLLFEIRRTISRWGTATADGVLVPGHTYRCEARWVWCL